MRYCKKKHADAETTPFAWMHRNSAQTERPKGQPNPSCPERMTFTPKCCRNSNTLTNPDPINPISQEDGTHHTTVHAWSTGKLTPLIVLASLLVRNAIVLATSSGVIFRDFVWSVCTGLLLSEKRGDMVGSENTYATSAYPLASQPSLSPSAIACPIAESIDPGRMALQRMPSFRYLQATFLVAPSWSRFSMAPIE